MEETAKVDERKQQAKRYIKTYKDWIFISLFIILIAISAYGVFYKADLLSHNACELCEREGYDCIYFQGMYPDYQGKVATQQYEDAITNNKGGE